MIGFFDSGLGGTCILNAFRALCPNESTVYIADSVNCPYGNRSPEDICCLSDRLVARLINEYHCRVIVVACNTATAAAIDFLRAKYPALPFVGLEPAVKPAALTSQSGIVGVLATEGTFNGRLYRETSQRFARGVTVLATVADEFVEFVERGELSGPRVEQAVRQRLEPLLSAGADQIVLGCTHFPHLIPVMKKVVAGRAKIIDPSASVAQQIKRVLSKLAPNEEPIGAPTHVFIRTGANGDEVSYS